MYAIGLAASEEVTYQVNGILWNPTHSNYRSVEAASRVLDSISHDYAMTIFVPSEEFTINVDAATGTTCTVYLSFYLTGI
jgi:hypothetical protein